MTLPPAERQQPCTDMSYRDRRLAQRLEDPAFREEYERAIDRIRCPDCGGQGWWADHEPSCYEAGECIGCDGVQVQCETCNATGRIPCSHLPAEDVS